MIHRKDHTLMQKSAVIHGHRLGGPATAEAPDHHTAFTARISTAYACGCGHTFVLAFAADATPPEAWGCPRCSRPATAPGCDRDPSAQPVSGRAHSTTTHMDHVKSRRSEAELEEILAERLALLRHQRRTEQSSLSA